MNTQSSDCFASFGHEDFDPSRTKPSHAEICPIRGCQAVLTKISFGRTEMPFCAQHGLRLHSHTYVYWNGDEREDESRLRNFPIQPELAKRIALNSVEKAESSRLGFEMSEDALTWNVFVGLAIAGKLRDAVRFLTGRVVSEEPRLYLWGCLVGLKGQKAELFPRLRAVRAKLEKDIKHFRTEPDVMLVIEGKLVVCIEAKFGSGNTLAHNSSTEVDEKPKDREGILRRYLDPAGAETRKAIDREHIGPALHSQLFRNVVFASEMAAGWDWNVVNLVSQTQWKSASEAREPHFLNPEIQVREYLSAPYKECFTFRTWESLYRDLVHGKEDMQEVATYLQSKSAHFGPAFNLH